MNKHLRFIAGAICPKCKTKDKIALTGDDKKIFCINCDYFEQKPDQKKNTRN